MVVGVDARRTQKPMKANKERNSGKSSMNVKKISMALSYVLRHGAVEMGLPMTPDGFCPLDEVLRTKRLRHATVAEVQNVVETNDKKRFKLEHRPGSAYGKESDDMVLCIRANQGHTISIVDPDQLCTRLTKSDIEKMPIIVHGTYLKSWESIQKRGLSKMKRRHIHFAKGLPGEDGVISGMRKSCEVCIYLDVAKCIEEEIPFYESDNGVVLTSGTDGVLPTKFFSHATDRNGDVIFDQRTS